jgi:hypothetical protein
MRRLVVSALAAVAALAALPLCGCAPSGTAPSAQGPETGRQRGASRPDAGQSAQRLNGLALGLQKFLADHNDTLPDLTDMDAVRRGLSGYVSDDAVFIDPRSNEPYGVNSSLSGRSLFQVADPRTIAVFYERHARASGARTVAFLDGHTASVRGSEWDEVKRISGIR